MEISINNNQMALARQEDLVVQEMPDEMLVYDLKRHEAHCLNKTAAFVWQRCDGQTTVAEMAKLLEQEVGSSVDEELIWYALDKLGKAELLKERVSSPIKDGLSRRRMIRRLGTLVAIPAVVSLVAPTALAQATIIVTSKKVADGTCDSPPGPLPNPGCLTDTCCTGSKKLCISLSPGVSDCLGSPCEPAGNAAPCN